MKNLPQKTEDRVVENQTTASFEGPWDEILAQIAPVEANDSDDLWQRVVDQLPKDKAEDTLRGRRFQVEGE